MVTKVGNLRVYCNGKIFVGPDWKSLCISFLLIFLPSMLYISLVASQMGKGILCFGVLLVLFTLAMLALTGLSNPGVIPRRPAPSSPNARIVPSTRTKDYKINGYTISTKYCTTCQIYRVPRCSHCAMSDNCVEKFDHYCPWVGTCIGRRNYRYFLMFVFSGTLLCLFVCVTSLVELMNLSADEGDFRSALEKEPITPILVVYTFGAVWFVGGLSVFHTYLVLTNQTTYEHIRRRFGQHGNPYNKGVFMNMFEACCQPNPPYDWDSDGSTIPAPQESSRGVELPVGVVLDPTIISMHQAAKEQAIRTQRESSNRGSDTGSCSHGTNVFRDNPRSLNEYPDSLYSSSSSVETRQPGMTGQAFTRMLSPYVAEKPVADEGRTIAEATQEEIQEDTVEISSTSAERRPSSRQSRGDAGSRRPSFGMAQATESESAARQMTGQSRRRPRQPGNVRGDSANTSINRFSETELTTIKSGARRTTNPFASYADESGGGDSAQLDVTTTLSSLTSNATSEIDKGKIGVGFTAPYDTSRPRLPIVEHVMSMQEIMNSQRSIPELNLSRKQSGHLEHRRGSSIEAGTKTRLFGSDGLARLRTLRSSGEAMFNNIRSLMKKQSKELPEASRHEKNVDLTEPVFIEIDEVDQQKTDQGTDSTVPRDPSLDDERTADGHGLRVWVPQLTPLSQQKYTELKEAPPSPFEVSVNDEIAISREVLSANSASSANNTEPRCLDETAFELRHSQLPRSKDDGVESLL